MQETSSNEHTVPLSHIFLVFLKIGTFAFGGVYSMLAFVRREVVEKRRWITEEEYAEAVVIGQMAPGPPIINTAIYIGTHLRGTAGAVAATLGQIVTGLLLAVVLAQAYLAYKDLALVQSVLKGIGSAVVGLLASVVAGLGRKFAVSWEGAGIATASLLGVSLLGANPIGVLLAAGLGGWLVFSGKNGAPPAPSNGSTGSADIWVLFATLFVINAFTIGGGYVMLPLIESELVDRRGWLTHAEFLDAIAVGQITPGPLTVMNAFIGQKLFGGWGAFAATLGSYLPPLIIATLAARHHIRYKTSPHVIAVFRAVRPAVVGLLASVLLTLAWRGIGSPAAALTALAAFSAIHFTRIDPTFVILAAGLLGFLLL